MAITSAPSPSAPQWRQFPFFNEQLVKDVHDLNSTPDIFKATPELASIIFTTVGLLVADIHGSVHILDRDFESTQSWIAHSAGRVTHMIERKGVLITLGEEDTVRSPLLKIWDLQTLDKKTGGPLLLRSTKVQLSSRPHPVTSIALSSSLAYLAIGLADGSVLLYRHLDQSITTNGSLTALPKPRTIHENATEPITGIGFQEIPEHSHTQVSVFVVTTNRVLLYPVSGKGSSVIDEVGCALGCATMDWRRQDMLVARDEAIYVCGSEGRKNCWAYEGHKLSISIHKTYLVIISPPFIAKASSASATVRNFVARNANPANDISKVTLFDIENKLVAYSGTFSDGVREVFSAWGKVYVLRNDGSLTCLEEKHTSEKLEMLYSKSLYLMALSLAKTQGLDEASISDIHRQFGDHLYTKGDYDGAMGQYVKTIGWLQPSYVIRKYLDAQRIHNLVTYLQELHILGLANADHTTLLLNTYTKLKDVARLDSFIKTTSTSKGNTHDDGELPFDLDTAIRVCRQAGYFEHASYLAKKYERHEDYLRIQIEDAEDYADALAYLRKLGVDAAESNLARYGRALLVNMPEETTQLLIDLCTTTNSLTLDAEETPITGKSITSGPSYLSYLALNRSSITAPPPSSDTATILAPSVKTVKANGDTATIVVRESSIHNDSRTSTPPPPSTPLSVKPPPVKRLSPRLYFAHFVDHISQFVVFLETVSLRRWGLSVDGEMHAPISLDYPADEKADELDQIAVWNTLLELYLILAEKNQDEPAGDMLKQKAMKILQSEDIPYDTTHALILCSTRNHTEGLVLLWEKMGMYEDVLRFWMDKHNEGSSSNASAEVVTHLNKYGGQHKSLYQLVLRFLTSTPDLLSKHESDVKDILKHVDENGILPPLGIVQILSRNSVASVGLVRGWLMDKIKDARSEISSDKEWIDSYRLETATKLKQVESLSDPDHPRMIHVGRCASCGGQIDLPAIHFMCGHSYHQRCLIDQEAECPNCAREHAVIREIRRNNELLADQHDVFLAEVQENGFKAVADAFSRGTLNSAKLGGIVL